MAKINSNQLFSILKNVDKNKPNPAHTNTTIINELHKILADTDQFISNLTEEQAIKIILWQGILNDYGIYGRKNKKIRPFYKKDASGKSVPYYFANRTYNRGNLLSIDFGTSNLGYEFSLTHAGIVIEDYKNVLVVVPVTSQKDQNYNKLPQEIKDVVIPIYKKDYSFLKEDSYILLHQIRAISKNRITKEVIGDFGKTAIMDEIEQKIFEKHSPFIKRAFCKIRFFG